MGNGKKFNRECVTGEWVADNKKKDVEEEWFREWFLQMGCWKFNSSMNKLKAPFFFFMNE